MTRVPARRLPLLGLGAFLAFLASRRLPAQEFEVPGGLDEKQPPTAKVIALDARLGPADPFHATNRPGEKLTARRGEVIALVITGTPKEGWHTYPLTVRSEDEKAQSVAQLTRLTLKATPGLKPLWPRQEVPEPEWVVEEGVGVVLEHKKTVTWIQEFLVDPEAKPGPVTLNFELALQVCESTCLIGKHTFALPLTISAEPPLPLSPEVQARLKVADPGVKVVKVPEPLRGKMSRPEPSEKGSGTQDTAKGTATGSSDSSGTPQPPKGLLASILTAILGGFISLVTPCVFPMIPITVSFFLKQSETGRGRTLSMAAVYTGTIVLVLTVGGIALMKVLVNISQDWRTNFILGVVFIFFALSLLGWYDITLPSFLQDFTSRREEKGGLVGVFFMALTFSIISFACVGPIYGLFIGLKAANLSTAEFLQASLAIFAFSAAFASPFFLLALLPSLLRTMPRSGSWLNAVKVVMGFLELAAAFKFLRAAEVYGTQKSEFLTFDLALGAYIALAVACGMYLLGTYRLPHDHESQESISVPRLLFTLAFFSLAVYLLPGLFKNDQGEPQRPRGEVYSWIESFLLPETEVSPAPSRAGGGTQGARSSQRLQWHTKLAEALADAKKQQRQVFIDFTGLG
jgi:thiol:disulfide interchange protein DsbD